AARGAPALGGGRMLPLELVLNRLRPIGFRRCEGRRQRDAARQQENAAQRHERESASAGVKTATTRRGGLAGRLTRARENEHHREERDDDREAPKGRHGLAAGL